MKIALVQQHTTSDKSENVARGLRAFEVTAEFGGVRLAEGRVASHLCQPRPLILADVSDNAGGGAASDSTFILRAMLDKGMAANADAFETFRDRRRQ